MILLFIFLLNLQTINLEYKSFEFTKIDWAEGLVCALLLVGYGDKALLRFEADADNLGFL